MASLPLVAIVGRANVGKSSLFNALVGRRAAIVADEPGTTRDTVFAPIAHGHRNFLLADTAGLKRSPADEFETSIQEQIADAAASADCILVVVEAAATLSDEDRQVMKTALRSGLPALLVVNKTDRTGGQAPEQWQRTGIREVAATSATQRTGLKDLLDWVTGHVPPAAKPPATELTIALIGRPNVGKSTLFNALSSKQQALVSAKAGTTRDVNRAGIRYHGQEWALLDTAGIRRPGRIARGVEHFSVLRAVSAIDEADICVLLIDVNEPATHLEQKLAGLIKQAGKGLIIALSKWDTVDKDAYTYDKLAAHIRADFQHVWWAPLLLTSGVTGQNLTKLFELAEEIRTNRRRTCQTAALNRLLQQAVDGHPPAGLKNRHPKLRYVTQSDTEPPAFRVYGSQTSYLHWSYKRRLEKILRGEYDFTGTPINLYFSDKQAAPEKGNDQ
jgi:GTP-binding protein